MPEKQLEPEEFRGPITGTRVTMPPAPKPRSKGRLVAGLVMALISTVCTLAALTSRDTRGLLSGTMSHFFGWLIGTVLVVGIPWTITAWLLRKPTTKPAARR